LSGSFIARFVHPATISTSATCAPLLSFSEFGVSRLGWPCGLLCGVDGRFPDAIPPCSVFRSTPKLRLLVGGCNSNRPFFQETFCELRHITERDAWSQRNDRNRIPERLIGFLVEWLFGFGGVLGVCWPWLATPWKPHRGSLRCGMPCACPVTCTNRFQLPGRVIVPRWGSNPLESLSGPYRGMSDLPWF
jgi:hypothetical protein